MLWHQQASSATFLIHPRRRCPDIPEEKWFSVQYLRNTTWLKHGRGLGANIDLQWKLCEPDSGAEHSHIPQRWVYRVLCLNRQPAHQKCGLKSHSTGAPLPSQPSSHPTAEDFKPALVLTQDETESTVALSHWLILGTEPFLGPQSLFPVSQV